jgi:hypothetical protein
LCDFTNKPWKRNISRICSWQPASENMPSTRTSGKVAKIPRRPTIVYNQLTQARPGGRAKSTIEHGSLWRGPCWWGRQTLPIVKPRHGHGRHAHRTAELIGHKMRPKLGDHLWIEPVGLWLHRPHRVPLVSEAIWWRTGTSIRAKSFRLWNELPFSLLQANQGHCVLQQDVGVEMLGPRRSCHT